MVLTLMKMCKSRFVIWSTNAGVTIISLLKFKLGIIDLYKLQLVPIIIRLQMSGRLFALYLRYKQVNSSLNLGTNYDKDDDHLA